MTRTAGTAPDQGVAVMANDVARLVLSNIRNDPPPTRWSAGLALACFAPPLPPLLHREVHRRLAAILTPRRGALR